MYIIWKRVIFPLFVQFVFQRWFIEPTQSSYSGLDHKDCCTGHHPRIIVICRRWLQWQRSSWLRVWVRDTQRLLAVLLLAEEDVTLQVDGVGVREPEHGVQLGAGHSSAGVEHELGQDVPLWTSTKRIKLIWKLNSLFLFLPIIVE